MTKVRLAAATLVLAAETSDDAHDYATEHYKGCEVVSVVELEPGWFELELIPEGTYVDEEEYP